MRNEVLETIKRRRSSRSYGSGQVSEAELQAVLEAGCCAPCAGNPPHITAVQNTGLIAKIDAAAKQATMHIGMPHLEQLGSDPNFVGTYGAPTIIIISDQEASVAPELNCAAAAQNMLIAAEALELGACWVHFPLFFLYGAQAAELLSELKLPDKNKPYACIALGYRREDAETAKRQYSEITLIQ